MRLAWGLLAVAACYRAPTIEQPCTIQCTDTCPGDLSCEGGYCFEPGQVCHPSFARVSAGLGFACAIDDTQSLWCWGSNRHNEIDPGTSKAYPFATRLAGTSGWTVVDAGAEQVCGIRNDRLLCWGLNDHGQVAVGTPGDVTEPTEIAFTDSPTQWTAVSA